MTVKHLCLAVLPLLARGSSPDTIFTYAGGGPNNVPATQANVPEPVNTAVDSAGNFYFVIGSAFATGASSNRVYKVNSSGTVTVFAGNSFAGYAGDGGPAALAELNVPNAAAVYSSGSVTYIYIADSDNCEWSRYPPPLHQHRQRWSERSSGSSCHKPRRPSHRPAGSASPGLRPAHARCRTRAGCASPAGSR
jgi:hypothetical protein